MKNFCTPFSHFNIYYIINIYDDMNMILCYYSKTSCCLFFVFYLSILLKENYAWTVNDIDVRRAKIRDNDLHIFSVKNAKKEMKIKT